MLPFADIQIYTYKYDAFLPKFAICRFTNAVRVIPYEFRVKMRFTSVLLSCLSAGALAAPVADDSVVKSHSLSNSWQNGGSLPDDTQIPVRIVLKQSNLDKGMDYLLTV